MNNKNLKNFIKSLKNISLSNKEKDVLRYRISEFISYHPIRNNISLKKKSFYFSIFTLKTISKSIAIILILVTVVGGTGVSYASTSALPGDILYGVKVNVTERIEEKLAVRPESKVNIQSAHVERRLNEAQILVQENRLSPQTKEIVRVNLERNLQNVTQTIENLKDDGQVEKALEVAAMVTPVLSAHKEVLQEKAITQRGVNDTEKQDLRNTDEDENRLLKEDINININSLDPQENIIPDIDNKNNTIESIEHENKVKSQEPEESEIDSLLRSVSSAIEKMEKVEEVVIEKILENEDSAGSITQNNKEKVDIKIQEIRGPKNYNDTQITESNLSELENKNNTVNISDSIKNNEEPQKESKQHEKQVIEDQNEIEKKITQVEEMLNEAENERLSGNIRNAFIISFKARKITEQITIQQKIKLLGEDKIQLTNEKGLLNQPENTDGIEVKQENKSEIKEEKNQQNDSLQKENQEKELIEEIEQLENLGNLTEEDVLESIEKASESLKKINQANLEAQNRL